jgi:hypothetical protein
MIPESHRGKNRSICSVKAAGTQHIIINPMTGNNALGNTVQNIVPNG